MILSFHPIFEADINLLCAGRQPDENDLAAIRKVDAVILPQGCGEALYRMARSACLNVFPNYDVRFQYPGKTGQTRLFQVFGVPHPKSWIFEDVSEFRRFGKNAFDAGFPLILKFDWGGEGETVFLINNSCDLNEALSEAQTYERTGQKGFVLQTFISGVYRSLRVVVVGEILKAYWRVQTDSMVFGTSVAKGARIDNESDPELQQKGVAAVRDFCRRTKINLAGFDVLFNENDGRNPHPLLLEINYFFGRTGIGGSEVFYTLLQAQIDHWLNTKGFSVHQHAGEKG